MRWKREGLWHWPLWLCGAQNYNFAFQKSLLVLPGVWHCWDALNFVFKQIRKFGYISKGENIISPYDLMNQLSQECQTPGTSR